MLLVFYLNPSMKIKTSSSRSNGQTVCQYTAQNFFRVENKQCQRLLHPLRRVDSPKSKSQPRLKDSHALLTVLKEVSTYQLSKKVFSEVKKKKLLELKKVAFIDQTPLNNVKSTPETILWPERTENCSKTTLVRLNR